MLTIQKKLSNTFYALLSLPATAMGFALCVQIAALSWILNTKYGFSLEDIGLVWLAGPMAGIFGQVIVGLVSDKVWFWGGRRRPFILIGGTLAALMILALPNLDVIGSALGMDSIIGVALVVALTLDLSINISFNPTRSVIADVTPLGEKRTKGYTIMQTVSGFFGVLAYLIGAFISNYTLIYIGAGIVFLFSILPIFFIEEPRSLEAEKNELTNDLKEAIAHKETDIGEFLKICFAHAFTWLGVQTMFVYSFAFVKTNIMGYGLQEELGQDLNNEIGFGLGVAFAILNAVGFLLPATVLQPISEKIGRVKTHTICIAIMAIGYAALVFLGTTQTSFFLLMAFVGIGWGAVVSLPFAIMSEVIDQRQMGLYMGLFNLSVVIPQIFASLLGGYLDGFENQSIIFVIAAAALAASAGFWLLVKEQESSFKIEGGSGH